MYSVTRRANSFSWTAVLMLVSALAAGTAYAWKPSAGNGEAAIASPPQDVTRIESRLSLLEQRFYSIETSIRSLEQQSRLSSAASGRTTRDPEISLLRTEVETLRRRLAELECGLAKVDERTLNATARDARRRSTGATTDPCRLNPDTPLRLPLRP
jgi:predicted RNase H-like nuclease (RuvC/YqgF family)